MKITKIILISFLTMMLFALSGWYICAKIILPKVLNSNTTKSKIEKLVYKKTKLKLSINNIMYQNGHLKISGTVQSENKIAIFKEITSKINADLFIYNARFAGKLVAKNLDAKITPSLIEGAPVHFDEAVFYYNGQTVTSKGCGTLGGEKACHILKINNAFTKEQQVFGRVKSIVTPQSVKYVKNFDVINDIGIKINYSVQNKIIDVKYLLDIQKDADIFYKNAYLGSRNSSRKIYIHTNKYDNIFDIKKYTYSILQDKTYKTMISGEGKLIKTSGRFHPEYLSAKTNGYAPSSITNYFNNYISGGSFAGDLEYYFEDKKLIGNFTIKDFTHKDFYVKKAEVTASKDIIDIKASGKYLKESFYCKLHGKNNFGKTGTNVYIYNMDLMLDKYIFKKHKSSKYSGRRRFNNNIDLTIENWSILVKSIVKNRIVLKNVKLQGTLVNNIFKFKTSKTAFAHGILSANGKYNFNNKISEIDFYADNIDSNTAADLIFNLPEQVKGTANARLRIKAYGKLENFKARAVFNIREGYLPKLGNKEFLFKKGKKRFRISNILKIKRKDDEIHSAYIKGSFYMDNYLLKQILITSQQKYLSFLLEGDFDLKNDTADLRIFGKYNEKAQKGIKVLFVPVKFIVKLLFKPENTYKNYAEKLDNVPNIDADKKETKYFRVKFSGNIKENKTKIETKSIVD